MGRSYEVQKRIDQRMKDAVQQAEKAMLRVEEVKRRIEVSYLQQRPLPSLREDSIPSMKLMESMGSMKSAELSDKGLPNADYGKDYGKGKDYDEDY